MKGKLMKKIDNNKLSPESEILPEYDFSKGVRGKYAKAYRQGHTVRIRKPDNTTIVQHFTMPEGSIVLEPDVQSYFPDSKAVNEALRALIKIIPEKKRGSSSPKRSSANVSRS